MLWGLGNLFKDPAWVQGIGSLLAVVTAIWITFDQRAAAKKEQVESQARKHRVDRTLLTFALNELDDYASSCLRQLFAHSFTQGVQDMSVVKGFEIPQLPQISLRDVAQCVSSAPTDREARKIGEILEYTQALNANMSEYNKKNGAEIGFGVLDDALFHTIYFIALLDSFFPYARFQTNLVPLPLTAADMEKVAFRWHLKKHSTKFARFYERVDDFFKPAHPHQSASH